MSREQIEMISIDALIPSNYPYRRLKDVIDFNGLVASLKTSEKEFGAV